MTKVIEIKKEPEDEDQWNRTSARGRRLAWDSQAATHLDTEKLIKTEEISRRQELSDENASLRNELDRRQAQQTRMDHCEAENRAHRIAHMRQEAAIAKLHRETDVLLVQNDSLNEQNTALRAKIRESEKHSQDQRHRLSQLYGSIKTFEDCKDSQERKKNKKVNELQAQLESSKIRNEELEERIEDLEELLATKKIKAQALQAEHKCLQKLFKDLQDQVDEAYVWLEEDQDLRMQNTRLKMSAAEREQNLVEALQEQFIKHQQIESKLRDENFALRHQLRSWSLVGGRSGGV